MQILLDMTKPWLGKVGALFIQKEDASFRHTLILEYAPLSGAIPRNPRRERPERAASSQPRATPWVSMQKRLRPVRAKVWAHLLFITFALTGRRCGTYVNPGRCPGLWTCWAFSPRKAARMSRNREIRSIRTCRQTCGASAPEGDSYLG